MTSSKSEDVPSLPEVALGKVNHFYKWVPIVGAVGVFFGFFVIFLYLSHFGLRNFIPDAFGKPENFLLISVGSAFIVFLFLVFLNFPWLLLTIDFALDSQKEKKGFRWSGRQLSYMYLLNALLMAFAFICFESNFTWFFLASIFLSVIVAIIRTPVNEIIKKSSGYNLLYTFLLTPLSIAFSFFPTFLLNLSFFKETTYLYDSKIFQLFVMFVVLGFQFAYMSLMYHLYHGEMDNIKKNSLVFMSSLFFIFIIFWFMQFSPIKYGMRIVGLIEMRQDSKWYKPTEKMAKEKAINFDYFSKRAGESKKNEEIKRSTAIFESKNKLMYGYFLIKIGSNAVFCPEYFGSEYLSLKEDSGISVQSLTHELCIEVSPQDLSAVHAQANLTFKEITISKKEWPFKGGK